MPVNKKCKVCKEDFFGNKNVFYCSHDCKLATRRLRRGIERKEREKLIPKKTRQQISKEYYQRTRAKTTKKAILKRREKDLIWNHANKEKISEYRRKSKLKTRGWFDGYKKTLKCGICGYDKCVGALDFHHKNPEEKEFHIGRGVGLRFNKEKILKEIAKCDILCANCHRELHYKEEQEKIEKRREEYLKVINKPKRIIYALIEQELEKEWYQELKDKAKYNLCRFGGNQYTRRDNGVKEKVDIKVELGKRLNISSTLAKQALQIYKRGTRDQKEKTREGKVSIFNTWKKIVKNKQ